MFRKMTFSVLSTQVLGIQWAFFLDPSQTTSFEQRTIQQFCTFIDHNWSRMNAHDPDPANSSNNDRIRFSAGLIICTFDAPL